MAMFTIQETCTYEVEAESLAAAKAQWIEGGPTGNIWDLMKATFSGVTDRSVLTNPPEEF